MTRIEAIKEAAKIDGWLTECEGGLLYDLALEADGPIVEIGSFYGRSTTCLALGSMAGKKQPVHAIDPFTGPDVDSSRRTSLESKTWEKPSEERLRSNLDKAGVNGLVKIHPQYSALAAPMIPECALLFIDGAHDYESVVADLQHYLPKVKPGGTIVLHDVTEADLPVVKAVDDILMKDPDNYKPMVRVDSAVVFRKGGLQAHSVFIAVPGGKFEFGVMTAMMQASRTHTVIPANNNNGWDDFNFLWAQALNKFEAGEVTHFAMLHSDVIPQALWLDTLLAELDTLRADLVSTVIPIKDMRGLTSTGIGALTHRYGSFRRYTVKEIQEMPATFSINDTPYVGTDKYLLHNTGCWVADLRQPAFRQLQEDGTARCAFCFPTRVYRDVDTQKWVNDRESEDWYFSRAVAELNLKTFATRKVQAIHRGCMDYSNAFPWGEWDHDKDTAGNWKDK